MFNWIERRRRNREATGERISNSEKDMYKSVWGKAGRSVGILLAKLTGRKEVATMAERTGEEYGNRVAKDMDWRIASRNEREASEK